MATFEKRETRKKRKKNRVLTVVLLVLCFCLNSTSFLKIPGLSLTYLEPLPRSRRGAEQPESSTPLARCMAATCFINENHALYLQKCSSADSMKPFSCTGWHLTQRAVCPINSACFFFFFLLFFLFSSFFFSFFLFKQGNRLVQKLHNCPCILLRNQWMLHAAEILVETPTSIKVSFQRPTSQRQKIKR